MPRRAVIAGVLSAALMVVGLVIASRSGEDKPPPAPVVESGKAAAPVPQRPAEAAAPPAAPPPAAPAPADQPPPAIHADKPAALAHLPDADQDQAVQKSLGAVVEPAMRRCVSTWPHKPGIKEVTLKLLLDLRVSGDSRAVAIEGLEVAASNADETLETCLRDWLTGQTGSVGDSLTDYDGRSRSIKPLAPGALLRLELPLGMPVND